MSSGDNVTLKYLEISDPNVIPANDAGWKGLAYESEDFSDNITGEALEEIADHADATSFAYGAKKPAGGFNASFREDSHDIFIEAFMGSTFNGGGVIETGKARRYFAIEKDFSDMTGNHFLGQSGHEVDGWEFQLQFSESPNESRISNRFDFIGRKALGTYAASQVGTGTLTAADTTKAIYNSQDVTLLEFDGGAICLSSLTFKGSRSKESFGCIGDSSATIITNGSPRFEISFEGYLVDTTRSLYEKAFASQNAAVKFKLNTATPKSLLFEMGNCGLLPSTPSSAGQGSENTISGTIIPVHNGSTASVKITRA